MGLDLKNMDRIVGKICIYVKKMYYWRPLLCFFVFIFSLATSVFLLNLILWQMNFYKIVELSCKRLCFWLYSATGRITIVYKLWYFLIIFSIQKNPTSLNNPISYPLEFLTLRLVSHDYPATPSKVRTKQKPTSLSLSLSVVVKKLTPLCHPATHFQVLLQLPFT